MLELQKASVQISLASLPDYPGTAEESPVVVETLGQPKCAFLGSLEHPPEDRPAEVLHVCFTEPACGQPLLMRYSVWGHRISSPKMPTNALLVNGQKSLFLVSPQETGFELGEDDAIFDRIPSSSSPPTIHSPRRICQARWLMGIECIRSRGDVRAIFVGAGESDSDAADYYLMRVKTFCRDPKPGHAIRVHQNAERIMWHYYLIPADCL